MHPATMGISGDFIATGTQLKIEKPTKGCVVTPCDVIDGPIVKFKTGSVKKLNDYDESKLLYKEVEEIIYFGDILFPLGDVMNRNATLIKPGYVEEWWDLELKKSGGSVKDYYKVNIEEAIRFSEKYGIPFHPSHIFYWTQISYAQFLGFIDWFLHSRINDGKILFPYNTSEKERFQVGKRALELLGVPHEVYLENVIVDSIISKSLLVNLGFNSDFIGEIDEMGFKNFNFSNVEGILEALGIPVEKIPDIKDGEKVLAVVNKLSKYKIKDKAGDFIGSRMGRPEKAKLRRLIGNPNVLFPVGEEGGRLRSVNVAVEVGSVKGDFPYNYCNKCNRESIFRVCEICGEKTSQKYYCRMCKRELNGPHCDLHENVQKYKDGRIDMKHYFEKAREKLGLLRVETPELIKGVRGTSSENHDLEHLEKGILRAKHHLAVNKDGTIRYDMTELPVSHFKPKEVEVSVAKLRTLGYIKDCYGEELSRDDQILELKPHDIIIPCNVLCGDEKADDVFINVAHFLDELLEKFYGLEKFYNIKTREDLVGQLGVCMAPHNCAGVICRIIGFSKVQGLLASPYMHAAMRRDCDGDEAAMMMLLDVLINFSRAFLPSHRGGTQDAPLVLNGKVYAKEVDDQILDFELVNNYPLELYEKAEQKLHSSEIKIEMVKQRIGRGEDPYVNTGFTHDTFNFNMGATCSSYKTLPTMSDKVKAQMDLCTKLRSVDQGDVARLIIDRHFMKDLKGNLRKFSQQSFRCGKCNEIYRRPPLNGKCEKCGNPKLIFTISYGSIVKYMEPALELVANFNVPSYIKQDLELTKKYIESIFGRDSEKQIGIDKWF